MNKRISEKIENWMGGPNEKNIIKYIIINEKVSRTQISKALGVSMSTVTNVTNTLINKNMIFESGLQKAERGRSFKLLQINNEKFKAIGIGINSKFVNVDMIDLSGKRYCHYQLPLNTESWQCNYDNIVSTIKELLEKYSEVKNDILGIGMSTPAFIDYNMQNLDERFSYEDSWNIDEISNILESNFEYGVAHSSSFSCILAGESYFGKAKKHNNIVYINVSSAGLSWARMENNIIDRVISQNVRSIGHTVVNINGPECTCSQHGCVELYTKKEALVDNYIKLLSFEDSVGASKIDAEDINYHKVLEYAEKGDFVAVQSVSKAATILGIALGSVASLLHPDMMILSGRIIEESNLFFDIVKKTINDKLRIIIGREIEIDVPVIHNTKTASTGFAALVFEQIFLDTNAV